MSRGKWKGTVNLYKYGIFQIQLIQCIKITRVILGTVDENKKKNLPHFLTW